jgi:hypothetical protein
MVLERPFNMGAAYNARVREPNLCFWPILLQKSLSTERLFFRLKPKQARTANKGDSRPITEVTGEFSARSCDPSHPYMKNAPLDRRVCTGAVGTMVMRVAATARSTMATRTTAASFIIHSAIFRSPCSVVYWRFGPMSGSEVTANAISVLESPRASLCPFHFNRPHVINRKACDNHPAGSSC